MDGFDGRQGETGAALAHACERLAQWQPLHSAKRVITPAQSLVLILLVAGFWAALWTGAGDVLALLHGAALMTFAGLLAVRLAAAAAALSPVAPSPPVGTPLPILTVLCPVYKEAAVLPDLIAALRRLDYPAELLDVKLILEADDGETAAALTGLDLPGFVEVLVVPAAAPRTKPKALNYAMAFARGDIVTVFDAEDRPHPQQPRAAIAAFHTAGPRLACVQAPLLPDNAQASWIAAQFACEYAVQFWAIVPLFARLGLPFPLGGTSNYFRRNALEACGGWDPYNVTEDADIGYRLARQGWRMGVIAPPTLEEAPVRFSAWRRQRTRWIKGHLQTWLVLMRNPGRTLQELGPGGFLAMQAALGGGLLAAFLHGPLVVWLLAVAAAPALTLAPLDAAFAVAGYAVGLHGVLAAAALALKPGLAGAALSAPLYWPLASWAALCSLGELIWKPHYWAKTTHGLSARGAALDALRPSAHALRLLPRGCGHGVEPHGVPDRPADRRAPG